MTAEILTLILLWCNYPSHTYKQVMSCRVNKVECATKTANLTVNQFTKLCLVETENGDNVSR